MIAIRHAETAEIQFVASIAGYGSAWKQYGPPLPAGPVENLVLVGGQWAEDPATAERLVIAAVKAEGERRKMLVLSVGGAKKTEYAEKRAEVIDWDTLGGTTAAILAAFNALPAAVRAVRFAHAVADAAAYGDTPADAIGRFRSGLVRSAITATISAVEARACALIKAATTAPAKRAAAAAVTWPA